MTGETPAPLRARARSVLFSRVASALALCALTSACVDDTALSQRCDDTHGCPEGLACVDGACAPALPPGEGEGEAGEGEGEGEAGEGEGEGEAGEGEGEAGEGEGEGEPCGLDAVEGPDGACYVAFADFTTWVDGERDCRTRGGHLASIADAAELALIVPLVPDIAWIGGNDLGREGAFTWSDGSALVFEAFAGTEPNNVAPGEDCVEMLPLEWNDSVCTLTRPRVCELRPPPSPCGNGLRDGAESCDDGNVLGGDGCTPSCTIEPGHRCVSSVCAPSGVFIDVVGVSDLEPLVDNAAPGAVLVLPPGTYALTLNTDLEDDLTIVASAPGVVLETGRLVLKNLAAFRLVDLALRTNGDGGETLVRARDTAIVRIEGCELGPSPRECIAGESDDARIVVHRSILHDCDNGAIRAGPDFSLVGNVIHDNGDGNSINGVTRAVTLDNTALATSVFAHNTLARNERAVRCNAGLVIQQSILWDNDDDLDGNGCTVVESILQEAPPAGSVLTLAADPLFVDPLAADFRLGPTSPARDASVLSNARVDLAGPRDALPDFGALEHP